MTRIRRVGTLTLGCCLIAFGVLFLLRLFIPGISYKLLLDLWPVVLILLGGEVVTAYIINKEERLKYDGAAFFLIIVMTMFAVGMGCMEYIIKLYRPL